MGIYTFEKRDRPVPVSSVPNESFDAFTQRMVEVARKESTLVVGHFYNNRAGFVELRCGPETEWKDIIEAHYAKFEEEGLRPEVTPRAQARFNNAIINLQFIDFSDMEEVLKSLHGFSTITNVPGMKCDPNSVLAVFKSHGYEPGMKFPGNDLENKAKRIIISCLRELKNSGKINVKLANTYIGKWLEQKCLN